MKRYDGMPHAFAHYNHPERGLSQSFAYIEDTSQVIRSAHFGDEEEQGVSNEQSDKRRHCENGGSLP